MCICSSRDSLDAVAAALVHSGGFNLAVLHSDLEEHEIQQQVVKLKGALQTLPQLPDGKRTSQRRILELPDKQSKWCDRHCPICPICALAPGTAAVYARCGTSGLTLAHVRDVTAVGAVQSRVSRFTCMCTDGTQCNISLVHLDT
jgi:hypothetical protein